MAKHKVTIKLNSIELGLLDSAEFVIHADGNKLGKVRITRNGLIYTSSVPPRKTIKGYWKQFEQRMKEWGKSKRKTKRSK